MSEVLSRAHPYIQLEEAMKSSTNHSAKCGDDGEKLNPQYEATTGVRNPNRGQPAYKRHALSVLSPSPL